MANSIVVVSTSRCLQFLQRTVHAIGQLGVMDSFAPDTANSRMRRRLDRFLFIEGGFVGAVRRGEGR
jgi:hypothetical protein